VLTISRSDNQFCDRFDAENVVLVTFEFEKIAQDLFLVRIYAKRTFLPHVYRNVYLQLAPLPPKFGGRKLVFSPSLGERGQKIV
jgi:hypothetical protein